MWLSLVLDFNGFLPQTPLCYRPYHHRSRLPWKVSPPTDIYLTGMKPTFIIGCPVSAVLNTKVKSEVWYHLSQEEMAFNNIFFIPRTQDTRGFLMRPRFCRPQIAGHHINWAKALDSQTHLPGQACPQRPNRGKPIRPTL